MGTLIVTKLTVLEVIRRNIDASIIVIIVFIIIIETK